MRLARWVVGCVALVAVSPAMGQFFPPPLRDVSGMFAWSAYVHLRYTGLENADDLYALRRVKLMTGGQLTSDIQWYAQALFKEGSHSPTDGRVYFQEAWLRFTRWEHAQLVFGQFKPPFGRERFTPDFEILTIDRSVVTDALVPDGSYVDSFYRDRGVQVDGTAKSLRYAIGMFDGRGANHQFHGVGPMVVAQVTKEPLQERSLFGKPATLRIGGAYEIRRGTNLPFRTCCSDPRWAALANFRGTDTRWNLESSLDWGSVAVRAEYVGARFDFTDRATQDFSASGFYILAARYLHPKWQVVAKFEQFDPNHAVLNTQDIRWTTLGLTYYIRKNRVKLMANYIFKQERVHEFPNNAAQVQMQYFIH